ncbi:type I DNA topoisomerase [Ravibacter arvi]|uniref:DNA topoisomerase 1 n=1 Tax=Ravibacter arvi TaxID=2051041 RepID=A0ABP8LW95_9BACT
MPKNLVIVESPAKAKTIENYLGDDFVVKSSFGHVRDLPEHDMGVDVEAGYQPVYEISGDKVKLVNELKKLAKDAEVWLATDDDREGEAISWHLKEALNLPDTTKRIVFREITKSALLKAIEQPRIIDIDLVNAQQARRVLDRLVGYELSPVLWKKIRIGKSSLSAGRVQSVAVRLIVEREREVDAFESKNSFKVTAVFDLGNGKVLQAELPKNFEKESEAREFLEKCRTATFSINGLETKPAKKTPAPPFTTSTLQQEASRKLSFSVQQTMVVAQKLYEAGKISYMRTDSTNLSQEALGKAQTQIVREYGADFHHKRIYKTKSESAQEAHEAIRPTEFSDVQVSKDRNEQRLYELIWKRAIASQMADAQIERTTATIGISTTSEMLVAQGEVIKFEGFLKVYLESNDEDLADDEEQKGMLPPLSVGQVLDLNTLRAAERFTRPPARYTEASLVKKLEEMGIGRPSTYAPTISTIIKREYVLKEDRPGLERNYKEFVLKNGSVTEGLKKETYGTEKAKLFPTNAGIIVNDFLVNNFEDIIDFSFTANVEKDFDNIAEGKLPWQKMIDNFYKSFHHQVATVESEKFDRSLTTRELGEDPVTGRKVSVRIGKYGPYVQLGEAEEEEKPRYANLMKGQLIETITLDEAMALFKLPREVGFFEDKPIVVNIGKYGPYVKFDEKYFNLTPADDPYTVDEERVIAIIEEKRAAESSDGLGEFEGSPVTKGKGRFGPYVKHDGKYYSLRKGLSLETITLEESIGVIKAKREAESNKIIKEFKENANVKIQNGRYGPYIAFGKRNIKIPKGVEPASLTYDDILKLAE